MKVRTAFRTALSSVDHHHTLSVVDHLDELRTRLIVALAVVGVAFAFCFWQNHRLLNLINAPLAHETQREVRSGNGPLGATYTVQRSARDVAVQVKSVVSALGTLHDPALNQALSHVGTRLNRDVRALSAAPTGDKPVTLGIGEPFNTTIGVSLIFALILSLPILLLQVYGFFMPALEPERRRAVKPALVATPLLFVAGVVFGYTVVLPAAVHFFQNFNSGQFNVLVQASQYYHFAATILLAMGLIFEVPVLIVAVTQSGVVTPTQLRGGRKYAIAACASVAAFLPGDAITMGLETVPLYLLFEFGVFVSSILERRSRRSGAAAVVVTQAVVAPVPAASTPV
jgi:sec-independent protein translocase protein TatC